MRKKKNLWSGVSILIVAVLVITAFIRGNAQAWLLAAAFVIWAVWATYYFLVPYIKEELHKREAKRIRKKCEKQDRIKWYLCTEQPHHFGLGSVTAREWQRKNMSDEDEAFWFDECRILPELGKLLRSVPENNFQRAEQLIVAYRYLAYDFDQPFLPQYRDNMLFLKAMLEKLA